MGSDCLKAIAAFWFKMIDSIVDFVGGDLLDFISPITYCYTQLTTVENDSLSVSGECVIIEQNIT